MTTQLKISNISDALQTELKSGRKNAIINGDFDIWQRNTTQTSNGYGSDDRWFNGNVGSTKTHSQQTFTLGQTTVPNNPKYYSRTNVTSVAGVGNYCNKIQPIEYVKTFSGETVTVSFYAKADAAKYMAVEFYQNFGTGGSPSVAVSGIAAQKVLLSTSWQKFTITTTIPSVSGKTLGTNNDDSLNLIFWFDAGSNFNSRTGTLGQQSGIFDISQVQVESGSVATEFEKRSNGEELALCQRYYEKLLGNISIPGIGGAQVCSAWCFSVHKRGTPTFTPVGSAYVSVSVSASNVVATSNASTSAVIGATSSVDAEL